MCRYTRGKHEFSSATCIILENWPSDCNSSPIHPYLYTTSNGYTKSARNWHQNLLILARKMRDMNRHNMLLYDVSRED